MMHGQKNIKLKRKRFNQNISLWVFVWSRNQRIKTVSLTSVSAAI